MIFLYFKKCKYNKVAYLKNRRIYDNFEKLEIMLLGDVLLYTILFGLEDLHLTAWKTSVLVSLYFTLLSNDNPSYTPAEQVEQNNTLHIYDGANFQSERDIKSSESILKKCLSNDLEVFKKLLLDHIVDNPPYQMKVFESHQVAKILDYINKTYCEKFSLYKYVFQNKKSNEEIR